MSKTHWTFFWGALAGVLAWYIYTHHVKGRMGR